MIPGSDVGYLTNRYWYWMNPFGNRAPRVGKIPKQKLYRLRTLHAQGKSKSESLHGEHCLQTEQASLLRFASDA
jgi:hypothetical protein